MASGIRTATGEVYFASCRFYYDSPRPVIQRLADLHQRALGVDPPFKSSVVKDYSPLDAFHAYSDASVALLAQLAIANPSGHVDMLGEIVNAATTMGTLEGLDGVFLSAARAAQYTGASALLAQAAEVFQTLGIPADRGGGALTTAIFDVGTGLLSFVTGEDIGQALAMGASGWTGSPSLTMSGLGVPGAGAGLGGLDLLFSGTLPGLGGLGGQGGSQELGISVGPSPELTGDIADGAAKVGGAIGTLVGGAVGFSAGAVTGPGAIATTGGGAAVGGTLGGAAGYLVGWAVEKLDTPYVAPSPDAHTGSYGPYGPFIQPYIGASQGSRTATGTPIPAPSGSGSTPAPSGSGSTPAPSGSGSTPAPSGSGSTPAPSGSGDGEKKTIKPGESTKSPVDDGSGGSSNTSSGPGWFHTRAPYGDGMATFAVSQREALLLIGLPRYDDDGSIQSDGFFPIEAIAKSGMLAHGVLRGGFTSPTDGTRADIVPGTLTPRLVGTGPSGQLTIPARVDGISPYSPIDSVRALLETIHKFQ